MQAGDEEKLRMGTGKDKKEIIVEQYSSQGLFRCNHNTVEHWGLEFVVQWKFRGLEEDLVSKFRSPCCFIVRICICVSGQKNAPVVWKTNQIILVIFFPWFQSLTVPE